VFTDHRVSPPTVALASDGLQTPVEVVAGLVPGGPWNLVIKDNDGTVVHERSGRGERAAVRWAGRAGMPAGTYWYKFTGGDRAPAIGSFTVTRAPYRPPFSDDDRSVHEAGIEDLYRRGITKGCTPTTFCPKANVSRAQMASFLTRTMADVRRPLPRSDRDWFSDDRGSAHEQAINALTQRGVSTGCGGDRFCPRRAIRRGDVAQWIARAFDLRPTGTDHFSDDEGTPDEWAINALADAGLTQGCTEDRYCADDPTSRGQMASFLSRTIATVTLAE
jgi:hypothetical protein